MDELYDRLSFLADEAERAPDAGANDRHNPLPAFGVEHHQSQRTRAEQARDVPATSATRLKLMA